MNNLAKLQNNFQQFILGSGQAAHSGWVSASGRVAPEIQLSVYHFAYRARLKEVLANDFPAIVNAIGDEKFNQLTNIYIKKFPSHYFSLRDFGKNMAGFIATLIQRTHPWQSMPWLYELALFEYALGKTFDSADAYHYTEQDMLGHNAETWPGLKFSLHPSVQTISFAWNTVEMWQTLTSDSPSAIKAKLETNNTWLIWREQRTTRFRSMPTDEFIAFNTLAMDGSFTDICEALLPVKNENDIPLYVASLLKSWVAHGLISGTH